jgi:hypothetical protein
MRHPVDPKVGGQGVREVHERRVREPEQAMRSSTVRVYCHLRMTTATPTPGRTRPAEPQRG